MFFVEGIHTLTVIHESAWCVSSFPHSPSLEEGGQTALGPAVLLCVSIASRVPGSKVNAFCAKRKWWWEQQPRSYHTFCSVAQVIICTDGLANKGVGHLDGKLAASRLPSLYLLCLLHLCTYCLLADDWLWHTIIDLSTDEAQAAAQTFYEDLGALALEKKYVLLWGIVDSEIFTR